jgi:UDP-N-acetylglucosamine 2-epimerase
MKLLRLLCPGHDADAATALRDAVMAFDRGLDIRLRFLSIGIRDHELVVTETADVATVVEAELARIRPDAVVLLGSGAACVTAASIAVRSVPVLARLGAGRRDGESADASRAIDHLSTVLFVTDDAAEATLHDEGLGDRVQRVARGDTTADPEFGRNVIKALRASRARSSGDSTC